MPKLCLDTHLARQLPLPFSVEGTYRILKSVESSHRGDARVTHRRRAIATTGATWDSVRALTWRLRGKAEHPSQCRGRNLGFYVRLGRAMLLCPMKSSQSQWLRYAGIAGAACLATVGGLMLVRHPQKSVSMMTESRPVEPLPTTSSGKSALTPLEKKAWRTGFSSRCYAPPCSSLPNTSNRPTRSLKTSPGCSITSATFFRPQIMPG